MKKLINLFINLFFITGSVISFFDLELAIYFFALSITIHVVYKRNFEE